MPFLIPDDLYYVHSMTTISYTNRPQNKLNINRLLRQEPCWESRNSSTSLKPKTLIIADWSLGHQTKERLHHILYYIDFLIKQGFLIYVWYDDDFVKIEDASFFKLEKTSFFNEDLISIDLAKILPQQTEVIKDKAVGQLGIPRDHLFVLQSNHLDNFSGYDDGYWFELDAITSYVVIYP